MSHPKNKKERFQIGKRKGLKRVRLWTNDINERERFARSHRDTTKLCGRRCCANPRKHEKEITLQEKKFLEKCINVNVEEIRKD